MSLLSWERGLKFALYLGFWSTLLVAPLVGAWIEIPEAPQALQGSCVAPLVGAWIEILSGSPEYLSIPSLLSWERGLKYL